jgi:thioesterase domain-containing protein
LGLADRVLPLRRRGTLSPFFCLPPASGFGWAYRGLLPSTHRSRPVYCLQSSDLGSDGPLAETVEEIADRYAAEIQAIHATGPYHLIGWSFGGLVAHATACAFQRLGKQVALLVTLDGYPATNGHRAVPRGDDADADSIVRDLREHLHDRFTASDVERILRSFQLTPSIAAKFEPSVFVGDMLVFTAAENRQSHSLWKPYADGQIVVHEIDCRHAEIADPKNMALIAETIEARLR